MKTSAERLSKLLKVSPGAALDAVIKAQLITAILVASKKHGYTHKDIADRSGVPRSAVTGILSGSMQKVSLNRVLRLLEAVHLTAEVKIKRAA